MKMISLFAGIGGFDLAAHWANIETVAAVEIDTDAQKVLRARFPNAPIFSDICKLRYDQGKLYYDEKETETGAVDIVCGGFPCQPFSVAGERKGATDERYLWKEMYRIIREVKPAWVVGENVSGLARMAQHEAPPSLGVQKYSLLGQKIPHYPDGHIYSALGRGLLYEILGDLEGCGYQVQTFNLPASAVNAWHERQRVWIVAYSEGDRNS